MVVAGLVLTLVSGLLLFFVYGLASLVPPDDPRYWSLVLERILRPEYGGWVAIPSLLGLLMGIGLTLFGFLEMNAFGRNG
jgi:hypothetical protein